MVDVVSAQGSLQADVRTDGSSVVAAPAPGPSPAPTPPGRYITWRGKEIPVIGPSIRDLRLRLSATILAIQVLGQTVLHFKISIAQILITMAVCGLIEVFVTLKKAQVLAWPASAIQTGASVAFILRASGTEHGDLWSLRGIHFFVLAAVLSLLSKYLIRWPNGRHVFNPSNVGIVAVLLIVGPRYVFSEHLWWESMGIAILITMAVILLGGLSILKVVKMIPMALSFLVTLGVLVAIFALIGRSFYATWRPDGVSGMAYWLNIALSPEVIAYVFFMISDPQTTPKSPLGRIIYGMGGAVLTAALLFPQSTEFGIKVAILSSLTVACALVPAIERLSRRLRSPADATAGQAVPAERLVPVALRPRLRAAFATPAVAAVCIIATASTIDTVALVANKEIVAIERNLPPPDAVPGSPAGNPHRQ